MKETTKNHSGQATLPKWIHAGFASILTVLLVGMAGPAIAQEIFKQSNPLFPSLVAAANLIERTKSCNTFSINDVVEGRAQFGNKLTPIDDGLTDEEPGPDTLDPANSIEIEAADGRIIRFWVDLLDDQRIARITGWQLDPANLFPSDYPAENVIRLLFRYADGSALELPLVGSEEQVNIDEDYATKSQDELEAMEATGDLVIPNITDISWCFGVPNNATGQFIVKQPPEDCSLVNSTSLNDVTATCENSGDQRIVYVFSKQGDFWAPESCTCGIPEGEITRCNPGQTDPNEADHCFTDNLNLADSFLRQHPASVTLYNTGTTWCENIGGKEVCFEF